MHALQNSTERKKQKQKCFFGIKKMFFEESYCYADAKPHPWTLFEGCQNGPMHGEFHCKTCGKTKPLSERATFDPPRGSFFGPGHRGSFCECVVNLDSYASAA